MYMLDTDICSYIMKEHPLKTLETLQQKTQDGHIICISVITYSELLFGAERSSQPIKHKTLIKEFCDRLEQIVPWDKAAANEYARLHSYLLKKGNPIGNNDTMIAGHALSTESILVTNNLRHFKKIPKLKIENWVS